MRVARALVRPTVRAVRWTPFVICLVAGVALLVLSLDEQRPTAADVLMGLRVAAVFGALALAFLFDDPAESTTAAVPVPLWVRRAVRVTLVVPLLALWWVLVLLIGARLAPHVPVPIAAVILEAAAVSAVTLALAAGGGRWVSEGLGGVAAAPGLLVAVAVAAALPESLALVVAASSPGWRAAHHRWAGILLLGVVAIVLDSRAPATRTGWRR